MRTGGNCTREEQDTLLPLLFERAGASLASFHIASSTHAVKAGAHGLVADLAVAGLVIAVILCAARAFCALSMGGTSADPGVASPVEPAGACTIVEGRAAFGYSAAVAGRRRASAPAETSAAGAAERSRPVLGRRARTFAPPAFSSASSSDEEADVPKPTDAKADDVSGSTGGTGGLAGAGALAPSTPPAKPRRKGTSESADADMAEMMESEKSGKSCKSSACSVRFADQGRLQTPDDDDEASSGSAEHRRGGHVRAPSPTMGKSKESQRRTSGMQGAGGELRAKLGRARARTAGDLGAEDEPASLEDDDGQGSGDAPRSKRTNRQRARTEAPSVDPFSDDEASPTVGKYISGAGHVRSSAMFRGAGPELRKKMQRKHTDLSSRSRSVQDSDEGEALSDEAHEEAQEEAREEAHEEAEKAETPRSG